MNVDDVESPAADEHRPPPGASAPALSRAALAEVWRIAWPTVLTMTSYTVMQFFDKLMVAQVGPTEVAAQGNGGIWAFSAIAFALGVLTVINTFVAQNLGAGKPERGVTYAWAGLWLSVAIWVGLLIPWALFLPVLFRLMGHDARLLELETDYAQIATIGALVLLANKTLSHYFFGMHRPKVIAVAAIAGNLVNVVGNYALIYGEAGLPSLGLPGVPGAPALGVLGAAVATVIGTLVELVIPLAIFLGRDLNARYGTRAAWRPDFQAMRDILRLGWPASIQWGNELVCWSIFMAVLVGRFGEDHMTAGWAALSFMHLSFMPAVGFSVAVSSLVGRYIGAGLPDVAVARARLGVAVSMVYMTSCAALFVIFRTELIGSFVGGPLVTPEQSARIIAIGAQLMIVAAIFQTADALGVVYTGALRGAGDTVWPGVVTVVLSWTFIVGLGAALIWLAPGLESLGPWIGSAVYIILYGVIMTLRFEGGHWRRIQLVDRSDSGRAMTVPMTMGPPSSIAAESPEDLAADIAAESLERAERHK